MRHATQIPGLAIAWLALGVGCGGVGREAPPRALSNAEEATLALPLNLRIVRAARDPNVPDPAFDLAGPRTREETVTAEGDVLLFERNLVLDPDHAAFFEWDEAEFGSIIVEAQVEARWVDARGIARGPLVRLTADFDHEKRRWFVALDALMWGRSSYSSPEDLHVVVFDLLTSDLKRREVEAKFRALGTNPWPIYGVR